MKTAKCCNNACNQGRDCPLRTESKAVSKVANFFAIYQLYRSMHSRLYSAQRAWGISFGKLPF